MLKIKEIDINKFNKSITFQNRGIGFTQIGIAGEILDLIDDLQQENKQLKERIDKAIEYIENETYEYDLTIKLQYFKDTYIRRYLLQILKGE